MRKRECSRLLLVPVMVLVVLFCTMPQILPVGASSNISHEKSIKSLPPSEILARARAWVTAGVQYSEDTRPTSYYQGYRRDCSGFVTMAWGLPPNLPGGGLFTGNQPDNPDQPDSLSSIADPLGKALDDTGKPIPSTMDNLQPGDILLNQGSINQHVIIFAGWVDKATKMIVSKPVMYTDGYYYYDGIEENGGDNFGKAVEHTPDQPWNYPYYPGQNLDPGGYYAWRFDATKAARLGLSPAPSIHPGGHWVTPSPKNGDTVTDVIHLVAQAYSSHQGEPAISYVYFTIYSNGSWGLACLPVAAPTTGDEFACDVNLQQSGIAYGQIQVSFDVQDQAGNISLAPDGVHTLNHVPTTTVPMPSTQTSCPATGTARAAVTEPLILGKDPNIVYVDNEGPANAPTFAFLKRYDVTTGSTNEIVKLPNTRISETQVSTDGQWVLFLAQVYTQAQGTEQMQSEIQMVRMDGQGLQTLDCSSPSPLQGVEYPVGTIFSNIQWSPNQKLVLFDDWGNGVYNQPASVYLLSLSDGTLQKELLPVTSAGRAPIAFLPQNWLDNTRAYVVDDMIGNDYPGSTLYLLDTSKGTNQQSNNLDTIADIYLSHNYDVSPDRTQLFLSTCTCGGPFAGGPSSVTVQPVTGGSQKTIYSDPTAAVTQVRAVSNTSVVLLIDNTGVDANGNPVNTPQNGLVEVNTDGSGLKRLVFFPNSSSQFIDVSSASPDGTFITYKIDTLSSNSEVLYFLSLQNRTATSFASIRLTAGNDSNGGVLTIVGWTMM